MKKLSLIIAGLLATTTVGLSQDSGGDVEAGQSDTTSSSTESTCFDARSVRNFDPLGDSFLYVEGRRDQHYLLTIDRGCFGLRNAQGIGISTQIGRVCSNSLAEIRFRGTGRRVESCLIVGVEAVEDKAAARALAASRQDNR